MINKKKKTKKKKNKTKINIKTNYIQFDINMAQKQKKNHDFFNLPK